MAVVCYVVKRSFICELAFTNWTQNANETDQTPCRASKMLYALSNKPNFPVCCTQQYTSAPHRNLRGDDSVTNSILKSVHSQAVVLPGVIEFCGPLCVLPMNCPR